MPKKQCVTHVPEHLLPLTPVQRLPKGEGRSDPQFAKVEFEAKSGQVRDEDDVMAEEIREAA